MVSRVHFVGTFLIVAVTIGFGFATLPAGDVGFVSVASAETETDPPMLTAVSDALARNEQSLIAFRRDIHRHPELSGQEVRTAEVIAERMKKAGLEVKTGIGGNGVVAILKGGRPGPVVAYRADMDAIPTTGPDPVEFRSENEGVRHGCGHDMHVTIAVGIAEALATVRDELPGTAVFIFQPSEENGEGAAAVIKDGALENPRPSAIFAVHCAPLEVGVLGSTQGMLLGGLDVVRVRLTGDGDLDAVAEAVAGVFSGVNTVNMGTPQVQGETDFTMAGIFRSGPAEDGNGTMLVGMVRCSSDERHDAARAVIEKQVDAITADSVTIAMEYSKYMIPPTINDPELVAHGNAVIAALAGPDAIYPLEGVVPFFSEDFSQFQQHIPGAMYFLGVSNTPRGIMGLPHSPMFVADEGAIKFGARAMSAVLLNCLENQ